jgi:hypothetical protein
LAAAYSRTPQQQLHNEDSLRTFCSTSSQLLHSQSIVRDHTNRGQMSRRLHETCDATQHKRTEQQFAYLRQAILIAKPLLHRAFRQSATPATRVSTRPSSIHPPPSHRRYHRSVSGFHTPKVFASTLAVLTSCGVKARRRPRYTHLPQSYQDNVRTRLEIPPDLTCLW